MPVEIIPDAGFGAYEAPSTARIALVGAIKQYQSQYSAIAARTFDINEQGENIDRSVKEISNIVAAGSVWVDYCRWPMLSRTILDFPTPLLPVGSGFAAFAQDTLGTTLGFGTNTPQFAPTGSVVLPANVSSALITTINPTQVPGLAAPYGLSYFPYAPYVTETTQAGTTYVLPVFGIQYGSGWYFYASGMPDNYVDPYHYAAFMANAIASPSQYLAAGRSAQPSTTTTTSSSPPQTTTGTSGAPKVTWNAGPYGAGVAGGTVARGQSALVTWQFTAPTASNYQGWSQAWDTASTSPTYNTSSGFLSTAGLSLGTHRVYLTFFFGGAPVVVKSPAVTVVLPQPSTTTTTTGTQPTSTTQPSTTTTTPTTTTPQGQPLPNQAPSAPSSLTSVLVVGGVGAAVLVLADALRNRPRHGG